MLATEHHRQQTDINHIRSCCNYIPKHTLLITTAKLLEGETKEMLPSPLSQILLYLWIFYYYLLSFTINILHNAEYIPSSHPTQYAIIDTYRMKQQERPEYVF